MDHKGKETKGRIQLRVSWSDVAAAQRRRQIAAANAAHAASAQQGQGGGAGGGLDGNGVIVNFPTQPLGPPNLLVVTVMAARGLMIADTFSKSSDPYTVVQIDCLRKGKAKRKTRVIKKNLTPRWNERFCFLVDPVKVRKAAVKGGSKAAGITMDVYDWDRIGTNDFLGQAWFPLDTLLDTDPDDPAAPTMLGWFPLAAKGKAKGIAQNGGDAGGDGGGEADDGGESKVVILIFSVWRDSYVH